MRDGATERQSEGVMGAHSPRMVRWFVRIFRAALMRDFHALRLSRSGGVPDPATPHLVIYANHPSWWDPVAFLLLGDKLFPGRPGYAPIDARMLGRYRFFARLGVFGVDLDSRTGAAFFRAVCRTVLASPERLLLVTAQGRFADVRERPVALKPGLGHIADWAPRATFVPLALDYVFWNERKPELLVRFGDALPPPSLAGLAVGERMNVLGRALEVTMDALAAEAVARDPEAFQTLVAGRSGVGGVYDVWRRARAFVGGKPFSANHGDER